MNNYSYVPDEPRGDEWPSDGGESYCEWLDNVSENEESRELINPERTGDAPLRIQNLAMSNAAPTVQPAGAAEDCEISTMREVREKMREAQDAHD